MSSFFIGRNVRVFGSAKFPCDGITLKAAKLVFSATACGCYAKSSRCEHKHSLTKVERVVFNALANNCGFAAWFFRRSALVMNCWPSAMDLVFGKADPPSLFFIAWMSKLLVPPFLP